MTKEIVTLPQHDIDPVTATLQLIERMAINPDVDADKMGKLVDLQIKVMDRQAEIDFNQAMIDLQPELPVIRKTGIIDYGKGGKIIKYAKIEDIERDIRPIYLKHGFSLSYDQKGNTHIGILTHKSGHQRLSSIDVPTDMSGGKNAIQGIVSAGSYAQRVLLKRLLNLVFEGDDDDGAGGPITADQADEIRLGLAKSGLDEAKFLKVCKAESIETIPLIKYHQAINAIDAALYRKSAKAATANVKV